MAKFTEHGGVIEASPSAQLSQVGSPSVSFFIAPDANIYLLGSFDRHRSQPFVNTSCFFPQLSLPNMNLFALARAVGSVLYQK